MIENQFNTTIKVLRTDNGTEYMNHNFQTFLHSKGIMHQTSCVGTPQQNGVAERKNHHLLEVTRALLFSANLPKVYWSYAVLAGCYLINRLPCRVLGFQSPFEILYNRKANISHLRVFGCICFVHSQNAGKLDHHAKKCIFVGYSPTQKGYKCYSPKSRRLFVSRDVRFDEGQMYYIEERQGEKIDFQVNLNPISIGLETDAECDHSSPLGEEGPDRDVGPNEAEVEPAGEGELRAEDGPVEAEVRRSSRTVRPSVRLQDFITYHTSQYPIQKFIRYDKLSPNYCTFLAEIDKNTKPNNFEEARKQSQWIKAMNEELEALNRNKTWELVELPIRKKTIGCRWVYKTKYKSDGIVERHKARLVAK
jgi:Reverse transcriptase (RNA-dependent DNA polymerase)